MRLHVLATIALFALHARAATISSAPSALQIQKKLPEPVEPSKEIIPAENAHEQELGDSANTISDVENNLRVKPVDSIPVKVIVEEPVDNSDIDRVEIDLDNPGEPQRQEHETQNPVVYKDEQQIVTSIKQSILDTQATLKQGFQGVANDFQNWISNNEQLSAIQANIQGLQESFNEQIGKLNATLQSFWNNNRVVANTPIDEVQEEPPKEIENVESHLKTLENNFQTGVKALNEGVEIYAILRADNESTTLGPAPANNLFFQYLTIFQNTLTQGFNNVTQAIQNYVGQNNKGNSTTSSNGFFQGINNGIQNILSQGSTTTTAAGAQADEPATPRPTIWQGIQNSFQNILNSPQQAQANPGQSNDVPAAPNRPIAQAIQNLPFVQGVVNLIQPPKPAQPEKPASQPEKPAQPAQAAAEPVQEGTNSVPVAAVTKPEAEVPTKADDPPAPQQPAKPAAVVNNNGPIKNIIQNNPIVKGISGAVHRLQASINPNAERPREPVKETNEKSNTKGHYYHKPGHSHSSGDNNDGSIDGDHVAAKSEPADQGKVEKPADQGKVEKPADQGTVEKPADQGKEEPVPEQAPVAAESKPDTDKTDES